ncbi:MAG: hypothetical protein PHN51_12100 [Candidatus Nanopelagicales bacterium]|nr:hypothetical protein [Candidatus Nanopelagicales bacterium]
MSKPALTQDLQSRLLSFNHRRLKPYELTLLAKAISERIALPPASEVNLTLYVQKYSAAIESVLYDSLNQYIHFTHEDTAGLKATVVEFVSWRAAVAWQPEAMIFSGNRETVIDEMSQITRYVDAGRLCQIGDNAGNANYILTTFRSVLLTDWVADPSTERPVVARG